MNDLLKGRRKRRNQKRNENENENKNEKETKKGALSPLGLLSNKKATNLLRIFQNKEKTKKSILKLLCHVIAFGI